LREELRNELPAETHLPFSRSVGTIGLMRANRLAVTVRVGKNMTKAQAIEPRRGDATMNNRAANRDSSEAFAAFAADWHGSGEIACSGYGRHL
jgi:hypothetical protein